MALLQPREGPRLELRAVSQLVNNVRNDGPELVAPLSV
jgi:putative SOS response-associated peptidase YedK